MQVNWLQNYLLGFDPAFWWQQWDGGMWEMEEEEETEREEAIANSSLGV